MSYLVTFLEGVITFISPCLLPMLPIYLSYFAAGTQGPGSTRATAKNALGFILGFTVTFLLLGTLAGSVRGCPHRGAALAGHYQRQAV